MNIAQDSLLGFFLGDSEREWVGWGVDGSRGRGRGRGDGDGWDAGVLVRRRTEIGEGGMYI
jgi:hypothetical protein